MAVVVERLYGSEKRLSTSGNASTFRYSVHGLSNVDDLSGAFSAGLPNIGDLLPDGSPCAMLIAEPEMNTSDRIVTVIGKTNFGYAGYTRTVGAGAQVSQTIPLSNWKIVGSTPLVQYIPTVTPIKRAIFQFVRTSFTSLADTTIELFRNTNQGRRYTINGIPCVLHDVRGLRGQSSAVQLETIFLSYGKTKSYSAGSFPNQSVVIPALDYLDEFVITPPDLITGTPPSIGIKLASQLYDPGDPFPWTL